MPDQLPGKGASLCTMGAYNFELLEEEGVPTHYRGVVTADEDDPVTLAAADQPPREMAIDLTQVPELPFTGEGYDYDAYYADAGENYLVPLEVVFRNTVPVGSSLRKRAVPRDVGLDRDAWPETVVDLPDPVVEFSTKYEEQDRYLDREEADAIAGAADLSELEALARRVNDVVTERAEEAGFAHEDGKIEVLYHRGTLKVADVVGTFDENRFSYDGQQVSKEVIRQWYRREHPEWVEAVSTAKEAAAERGVADWRQLCEVEPKALPEEVLTAAAEMYQAGTNAYTDREWFDAPSLGVALDAVRDL
jgi:phosphoribosylaminoimidazole-succinocarboxamide synthase